MSLPTTTTTTTSTVYKIGIRISEITNVARVTQCSFRSSLTYLLFYFHIMTALYEYSTTAYRPNPRLLHVKTVLMVQDARRIVVLPIIFSNMYPSVNR